MQNFEKISQSEIQDVPPIQAEKLEISLEPMEMSAAGVPEGNELVPVSPIESEVSTETTELQSEQVLEGELLPSENVEDTDSETAIPTDPAVLEGEVLSKEVEMAETEEVIADRKSKLNAMRTNFGLAPTDEDPPSVLFEREQLRGIENDHEELVNVQYGWNFSKERRLLLRNKFDSLFEEFDTAPEYDFELSFRNGYRSKSFGEIEPEIATYLAERYRRGKSVGVKKGSWSLVKLFKDSPEMLKTIEQRLPQENADLKTESVQEATPDTLETSPDTLAIEDKTEQVPQLEDLQEGAPIVEDKTEDFPQLEDLTKKQGEQVVPGEPQG